MAYILEMNECNLVTKTNSKPIQNQLKNNSKMNYKLNSWELESKWSRSFNIK